MSFPQTRITLVTRLAEGGNEEDWSRFLADYHGPVCRFAQRWGARDLDDAEDIALQTFEILWEKRLLNRWIANRSAKLRSLLCSVVRNLLSNRNRVRAARAGHWPDVVDYQRQLDQAGDASADAFYAAWVEDLLQRTIESLAAEYHAQSKGDYIRVLYGRLCQRQSVAAVAETLGISAATADHYYRHARDRLAARLEELVRGQAATYCAAGSADDDFNAEWQQLGAYLSAHGGLEKAVEQACSLVDPVRNPVGRVRRGQAASRLTSMMRSGLKTGQATVGG